MTDKSALRYFHCLKADALSLAPMVPHARFSAQELLPAYQWAKEQIGFFPLFLAAGDERAVGMTGYSTQWNVYQGTSWENGRQVREYRQKGEFPSYALLEFLPDAFPSQDKVFTDYDWWHVVINDCLNYREPGPQTVKCLFKRSWSETRWHREALKRPYFAQLLVPCLEPARAVRIWVRNQATREQLVDAGFENVVVRRIPVDRF